MSQNIPAKIFLIGLMGSGKSHWGRHLATHLHYPFLDLDKGIEMAEIKTVAEIFETKGEAYFRQREADILRSLTSNKKFVLSCGGGAPCFHENMDWMLEHGIVIWLHPPLYVLAERLIIGKEKRPLLKNAETKADIEKIMGIQQQARSLFYEKAHFKITDPNPSVKTFEKLLAHA
jgi:shikimate kinase